MKEAVSLTTAGAQSVGVMAAGISSQKAGCCDYLHIVGAGVKRKSERTLVPHRGERAEQRQPNHSTVAGGAPRPDHRMHHLSAVSSPDLTPLDWGLQLHM